MHAAFMLLVTFFVLNRAIEKGLTFLNLRYLKRHGDTIPLGFEGKIDGSKLRQIRDYTLAKGKVAILSSLWRDLLTGGFFFGGLLELYSGWINGLGMPSLPAAVLFFVLLGYAEAVAGLPFQLYATFGVEQRFGFNRQTKLLWLLDLGKNMAIGTLLSVLLLFAVFWLIELLPQHWWLAVWLLFCAFNVLMLYLIPYVIEPWFNKFTPLDDKILEERLRQVLARAGLQISQIFRMDASKRSGHSNAYFSGLGRVKRIVLFDTLLASHSHNEIAAILAHEAGHWKKKHIVRRLFYYAALALIVCYLLAMLSGSNLLPGIFGVPHDSLSVRLLLAGFVLSLFALPFTPLASWYSRHHEEEADRYAVLLLGESVSLAKALVKLGVDNLANLHPHPLYAGVYFSHPPLIERVQELLGKGRRKKEK